VTEYPQLCEAQTEVSGRLLGTPMQRFATIAHGDGMCATPSLVRICSTRQHRRRHDNNMCQGGISA
jgi:hypothetical protein